MVLPLFCQPMPFGSGFWEPAAACRGAGRPADRNDRTGRFTSR